MVNIYRCSKCNKFLGNNKYDIINEEESLFCCFECLRKLVTKTLIMPGILEPDDLSQVFKGETNDSR